MIIVFGSINIDLFFTARALPRPGETVLCPTYRSMPGGKGLNQAIAAARAAGAGGRVRMAGRVGPDGFAALALDALDQAGVDRAAVAPCEQPTGCAAICVDATSENHIMVGSGANRMVGADQVPDDWLGPEVTLILQMEVPLAENWRLVERARAAGARIILNLAPAQAAPGAALANLDYLIVNEIEAVMLARESGLAATDPSAAARALCARHEVTTIVSLGAAGAEAHEPDAAWTVGALAIEPVDTVAAGDAFVGAFATALDAGHDLPDALRRASVAGGLACLKAGAAPSLPFAKDIEMRLEQLPAARRL